MREKIRDIKSARAAKDSEPPRGLTPRSHVEIVAGDIAGLSRLMDLNAGGTHARVKRIQRDLIEPSIAEHDGRLLNATEDGFIAIFNFSREPFVILPTKFWSLVNAKNKLRRASP